MACGEGRMKEEKDRGSRSTVCHEGRNAITLRILSAYPKSPKEMTGGMMYFPRILDKIRLHARGELGEDYHANLGKTRAADGACVNFLRVKYADLRERVLAAEAMKKSSIRVTKRGAG